MKSVQGGFAALVLAMAASSASGADSASIAIGGCHTSSPQQGVPGATIPEGYFYCGTILGQPVCSPEIAVDGVPGGGTADEYCSQLTSGGSGSMAVREKTDCPAGKTGVIVERTGESTFALSFTKNDLPLVPTIEQNSPPNTLVVADFCFLAPGG